jgi:hypothetical protein
VAWTDLAQDRAAGELLLTRQWTVGCHKMWGMLLKIWESTGSSRRALTLGVNQQLLLSETSLRRALITSKSEIFVTIKFIRRSDRTASAPTCRRDSTTWSEVKWSEVKWSDLMWSDVKWSEATWRDVKSSEVKRRDVTWSNVTWHVVKWSDVKCSKVKWRDVKWSDVKWSEVKWSEVKWSEVK